MSARLAFVLVSVSLALSVGCSKDDAARQAPPKAPPGAATSTATADQAHAPTGVKPGSHEDWCAEHAVPESQCTRCDPSLIPAFKATSDWCEAHQLPLSQDTIHTPGLVITRPPKGS